MATQNSMAMAKAMEKAGVNNSVDFLAMIQEMNQSYYADHSTVKK